MNTAADMPVISTGGYSSTAANPLQWAAGSAGSTGSAGGSIITPAVLRRAKPWSSQLAEAEAEDALLEQVIHNYALDPMPNQTQRRIVQVFIADITPDVPMDRALLYRNEPKFTDATDQELFFEVPIADLLKAHNEARIKWLDKDASRKAGKDVFLEPIKIRDLRMVVVEIAKF